MRNPIGPVLVVPMILGVILAAPVLAIAGGPARADEPPAQPLREPSPDSRLANDLTARLDAITREALDRLEALSGAADRMIRQLPRFAPPYVDEHGNIVIERRDTPPPQTDPQRRPRPDEPSQANDPLEL